MVSQESIFLKLHNTCLCNLGNPLQRHVSQHIRFNVSEEDVVLHLVTLFFCIFFQFLFLAEKLR